MRRGAGEDKEMRGIDTEGKRRVQGLCLFLYQCFINFVWAHLISFNRVNRGHRSGA